MAHELESALLKLDRARKHINDFEAAFRAVVEAETHKPVHQANLNTGWYYIRPAAYAPPPYLSAILGDAIQDARAALEHVVWAAVVRNRDGVDPPNPRDITFPIDERASRFNQRPVLRFLLPEQRAILQSHQPYLRRGDRKRSVFGHLRELADADKHRELSVLATSLSPGHHPLADEPTFHNCGPLIEPYYTAERGMVDPRAPLAIFQFEWLRPDSYVDVELSIAVEPATREGDRLWTLFPMLDHMCFWARIVIREFEPFFPPLPVERKTLDRRLHDATGRALYSE